jgi:hypothetical protein
MAVLTSSSDYYWIPSLGIKAWDYLTGALWTKQPEALDVEPMVDLVIVETVLDRINLKPLE